ncbi:hypothetical protein ABDX87_19920 [Pseudomonas abietaniphila]|uniref:hypothetical protein n=1 Tax=Pseudomonas abietaniphila TaxID=89065 RepID=UPI0032165FE3
MIKEIEELMIHWGEHHRRYGLGGGIGSQMGSIMEWKGLAPRGTPGSRIITGAAGMDHVTSEVDAALAQLRRTSDKGCALASLAQYRYLEQMSIREQMRALCIAEGADRTYRNWVTRLHQQVLLIMADRNSAARGAGGQMQKHSHSRLMVAKLGRDHV